MTGREEKRQSKLTERFLGAGAITIDPNCATQFASGLLSPCFCDCSVFQWGHSFRRVFVEALRRKHREVQDVLGLTYRLVPAAVATGAIVFAAWVSPGGRMLTVRKTDSSRPPLWRITGSPDLGEIAGTRFIVFEDVFTRGTNSLRVVETLRQVGGIVGHILAVAHYGLLGSRAILKNAEVELLSLLSIPELVDAGYGSGRFSDEQIAVFKSWHTDSEGWTARWRASGRPVRER